MTASGGPNALYALAEVFDRQVGEAAEGTGFDALAGKFRMRAIRLLGATPLRIDPSAAAGGGEVYSLVP